MGIFNPIINYFGVRQLSPEIPAYERFALTHMHLDYRVHWFGTYLRLPNATCAQFISPAGTVSWFTGGQVINLPAGLYTVFYIDMRPQRDTIRVTDARTIEGLQITVRVSYAWKIMDYKRIGGYKMPKFQLENAFRSAVRDFVRHKQHHELVFAEGEGDLVNDKEMAREIKTRVENEFGNGGLVEIRAVDILSRRGHERVDELAESSVVKRTEREQELVLHIQELKNDLHLAGLERRKAEIDADAAREKAHLEVDLENIVFPIRKRLFDLEDIVRQDNLSHDERMHAQKIFLAGMQQLILMEWSQAVPGVQGRLDPSFVRQALRDIFQTSIPPNRPASRGMSDSGRDLFSEDDGPDIRPLSPNKNR